MSPVFWIPIGIPGSLGIMPRPTGGDRLADEVMIWRTQGVHRIISALEAFEQTQLDLEEEGALCEAVGIAFDAFPIPDRSVPDSEQAADRFIGQIAAAVLNGQRIAVHCRMGIGRSGLLTASTLVALGCDPSEAFLRVSVARGVDVPDTREQYEWVQRFAVRIRST
ncbi:MAG TPA: protein-tyrosine phosphatase family protein [Fimbriimonadaceae bacterium]|nr:protein-tyrosine phosphatase family protein [Fimbriimonadaceae bacterium]